MSLSCLFVINTVVRDYVGALFRPVVKGNNFQVSICLMCPTLVVNPTLHNIHNAQAMSDCDSTSTLVGVQPATHDAHCTSCVPHEADVTTWMNEVVASMFVHPLMMYSVVAVLAQPKCIVSAQGVLGMSRKFGGHARACFIILAVFETTCPFIHDAAIHCHCNEHTSWCCQLDPNDDDLNPHILEPDKNRRFISSRKHQKPDMFQNFNSKMYGFGSDVCACEKNNIGLSPQEIVDHASA